LVFLVRKYGIWQSCFWRLFYNSLFITIPNSVSSCHRKS
jgi:hypothetical protein